jgi:calcineurin-like phosphoesterase family protein
MDPEDTSKPILLSQIYLALTCAMEKVKIEANNRKLVIHCFARRKIMVYIWSDLHLGHANIIKHGNRPFADVEAMDQALLHAWRTTVKPLDTIINLGDVSLRKNKEYLAKTIQSLPGYKILVFGNHDRGRSVKWWLEIGFDEAYKYPIVYEGKYILSHEAVDLAKDSPFINIHGHIHQNKIDHPRYVNVCVEITGHKPVPFEAIAVATYGPQDTSQSIGVYDANNKTAGFPTP